jgi:Fe-S cluster assembly scaffold protein SufB
MGLESWLESIRERAKSALNKPAKYGVDIDVTEYLRSVSGEPRLDTARTSEVGVDLSAKAYYTQVDQLYFNYLNKIPGIEVKRVEDFIEESPDEARNYVWRLIDPAMDKYTAIAALRGVGGYFIRVKENTRVEDPVMTCLFMSIGGLQAPHNIAVVEKGAEVTIYTGCTIAPESLGLHVGITEYYVEEGATLRYVMVHSWNRVSHVRPRTAVWVKPGGQVRIVLREYWARKNPANIPSSLLRERRLQLRGVHSTRTRGLYSRCWRGCIPTGRERHSRDRFESPGQRLL